MDGLVSLLVLGHLSVAAHELSARFGSALEVVRRNARLQLLLVFGSVGAALLVRVLVGRNLLVGLSDLSGGLRLFARLAGRENDLL